jgi:hypothetical protein
MSRWQCYRRAVSRSTTRQLRACDLGCVHAACPKPWQHQCLATVNRKLKRISSKWYYYYRPDTRNNTLKHEPSRLLVMSSPIQSYRAHHRALIIKSTEVDRQTDVDGSCVQGAVSSPPWVVTIDTCTSATGRWIWFSRARGAVRTSLSSWPLASCHWRCGACGDVRARSKAGLSMCMHVDRWRPGQVVV